MDCDYQDNFDELKPLLWLSLNYTTQHVMKEAEKEKEAGDKLIDPFIVHLHSLGDFMLKDPEHEYLQSNMHIKTVEFITRLYT